MISKSLELHQVCIIKNIIWDWNGTLLNDAKTAWKIFNSVLSTFSLTPVTFEHYQTIYGHPIQGMYEAAGMSFSERSFDEVAREWHSLYVKEMANVALHDDALEVVRSFDASGVTQTVLSALPHEMLVEGVTRYNLDCFFQQVSGLEDFAGVSKIDNGKKMMQALSLENTSTVLIGDSTHDAEVAKSLGIHLILVSRGYEDEKRLRGHGVPVVGSLIEAAKVVSSWSSS